MTWIRDPRAEPPLAWHRIDGLDGYPEGATGVSLTEAVPLNALLVTVVGADGVVAQTTCAIKPGTPPPGADWAKAYCAAFTQITPPTK
ncbi:hypothetical protein [Nonomuraea sp. B19D2]|uniref:hypothetical protein n=1 Tax=Nonomuraea sp. B19D2 TaxID=3159561 RepID=UPI0032DA071F